ncbi:MAG: putative zinc-binding metallopeptidase [Myxococcaceae bacterium]|nr:putative zinc-binding metallopeptidase [Myxococcaceae bacterium]
MAFRVIPKTEPGLPNQLAEKPADQQQLLKAEVTAPTNKPEGTAFSPKAPQLIAAQNAQRKGGIVQEPVLKDAAPGWEFLASHPALAIADLGDKTFLSKYTQRARGVARQALASLLQKPSVKAASLEEQGKLIGWFAARGYGLPANYHQIFRDDARQHLETDWVENAEAAASASAAKPPFSAAVVENYPFFMSVKGGAAAALVATMEDSLQARYSVAIPLTRGYTQEEIIETIGAMSLAVDSLPKPLKSLVDKVIVEPNANPDDAYWKQALAHLVPTQDEVVEELPVGLRSAALETLKKHMPWEVTLSVQPSVASASAAGEIRIFPGMKGDQVEFAMILRHELAHTFAARQRGSNEKSPSWTDWVNAEMSDRAYPSRYSMANPVEDYAETAALYLTVLGTDKEAFHRSQFPGRFNILDREFQDADMEWWVHRKISGANPAMRKVADGVAR